MSLSFLDFRFTDILPFSGAGLTTGVRQPDTEYAESNKYESRKHMNRNMNNCSYVNPEES
ncbi:hypothetical protein Rhal01_00564 [Rubritalea halochordaticola]|uniref:Uncharacterized protein n=1 Tax=Rubritalea halochordaticola TaxID=714537 RepID=A0ABP9UVB8_9BACT